jgi:hypothetical protein
MMSNQVVTYLHPSEIYMALLDIVVESVQDSQTPLNISESKEGDQSGAIEYPAQSIDMSVAEERFRKNLILKSGEMIKSQRKGLPPQPPPQASRSQEKDWVSSWNTTGRSSGAHKQWQELAWLLSRKRSRMNPSDLLSRLPDEVQGVCLCIRMLSWCSQFSTQSPSSYCSSSECWSFSGVPCRLLAPCRWWHAESCLRGEERLRGVV